MSSAQLAAPSPGPVRPKRYKSAMACTACRRRKLKCDGARPVCSRCQKEAGFREPCKYIATSEARGGSRSSFAGQSGASSSHAPSPVASTSWKSEEQKDAAQTQGIYGDGGSGLFASKVTEVIDAKLGLPSVKERPQLPLIDIAFFGNLQLRSFVDGGFSRADNVLPPRKHADLLMSLYWRHIDPMEPVLDQADVWYAYQALFNGGDLKRDERVFTSTLNVVFALASQLQESIPSAQREDTANTFFERAWSLLRPETAIWEPGSVPLVQCLLLMCRYLQCSSNPHLTWMTLGSAMRIMQGLGFHTPEKVSPSDDKVARLKRELWHQCAQLERGLQWCTGRPLTIPSVPILPPAQALKSYETAAQITVHFLELEEMGSHIQLLQNFANSSFGEMLSPSYSLPKGDLNAAMHFDERLSRLSISFEAVQHDTSESATRRGIYFRIRLAHTRILVFRPMLARFCLAQSHLERPPSGENHQMKDHVLQSGALLCVEYSKELVGLVLETYRTDGSVPLLAWWYRVFYLYIATQHLVAGMLRPDVFAPGVIDSWTTAMSALCAHEHLSKAVTPLIAMFRKMWQKASDLYKPEADQTVAPERPSDAEFQDIFQHLGFEAGNYLFGLDNAAWLDTVDWTM